MKRFYAGLGGLLFVVLLMACTSSQDSVKTHPAGTIAFNFAKLPYSRGAILNSEKYDSAPLVESDGTRGVAGRAEVFLPKEVSLKEYAPIPGNQGGIGSCFAWASAYAAKTIMESQSINRTDKFLSTKMAFSPLFIYHAVREYAETPDGSDGGSLYDTVLVMASVGVYRKSVYDEKSLSNTINPLELKNDTIVPVTGFGILFHSNAAPKYRVDQVKKNIFEGNPVIIAAFLPDSFTEAKDVWIPKDGETAQVENGHAVCVVGYNDEKYGGAFEIINSWGEEWGNGGYTWLRYDDFGKWVEQAWIITEDISYYADAAEFTGKVSVSTKEKNEALQVRLSEDGKYRLSSKVKNGTQIRLNIDSVNSTANQRIYSYAFYTNAQNNRAVKISNDEWIKADDKVKADNLVILYSRTELDIDTILKGFEKSRGDIPARLGSLLEDFIPLGDSKYEYDSMQVTADLMKKSSTVGMILSIDYNTEAVPYTDMVKIKGGSFVMGSPASDKWHLDDEAQKKVTLGDYYIGATEVTVGEFRDFQKSTGYKTFAEKSGKSMYINYTTSTIEEREGLSWENAAFTQEDSHPVVHINIFDAIEYCNWLSRQEGLTPAYINTNNVISLDERANGYRLPTEAEWEYACRAGTNTPYNTGNTITPDLANYSAAWFYKTTPVRKYAPNKWGIYDTHGNVFEWCWDTYSDDLQNIRGSAWFSDLPVIRSAYRSSASADYTSVFIGFRLARSAR